MAYISLILMSVLVSFGQILLKSISQELDFSSIKAIFNTLKKPSFILVITVTIIGILLYTYALTQLPLGIAFSFNSLSNLFVVIGSYFFLKEKLNKKQLIGLTLIILGIITMTL